MAKRRGLLGRLFDRILGRTPPTPVPRAPAPPPSVRTPVGPLRQRAADHIIATVPFAKADNVRQRVKHMDTDELLWTIRATLDQLRWRAGQKPDRLLAGIDGIDRPLNPWWYK